MEGGLEKARLSRSSIRCSRVALRLCPLPVAYPSERGSGDFHVLKEPSGADMLMPPATALLDAGGNKEYGPFADNIMKCSNCGQRKLWNDRNFGTGQRGVKRTCCNGRREATRYTFREESVASAKSCIQHGESLYCANPRL